MLPRVGGEGGEAVELEHWGAESSEKALGEKRKRRTRSFVGGPVLRRRRGAARLARALLGGAATGLALLRRLVRALVLAHVVHRDAAQVEASRTRAEESSWTQSTKREIKTHFRSCSSPPRSMSTSAGGAAVAPLVVLAAKPRPKTAKPWYFIFAGGIAFGALLAGYAVKDSPPVIDATSSLASMFAEFDSTRSLASIFADFDIPFVDSTRLWLASSVEPFAVGIDALEKGQVRIALFEQLALF